MDTQLPREAHLHGFKIFATRTKHHQNKLKYFHVGATQQVPQSDGTSVLCKKVVLSYSTSASCTCIKTMYLSFCLLSSIRCYYCWILLWLKERKKKDEASCGISRPPVNVSDLIHTWGHLPSILGGHLLHDLWVSWLAQEGFL